MLFWLWLLCLAVPLLCVWLGSYLFCHVTDRPHVFLQLLDVGVPSSHARPDGAASHALEPEPQSGLPTSGELPFQFPPITGHAHSGFLAALLRSTMVSR